MIVAGKTKGEQNMYIVSILYADQSPTTLHEFIKKPTFKELYPLIQCDTIEIQRGLENDQIVELYCDEESKLKNNSLENKVATNMWYNWQDKTGHMCIPGDFIAGNVAIIEKVL